MPAKNTVDFHKEKKKATARKVYRKLRIPAIFVAVLCIFAVILACEGEVRRSNIMDSVYSVPKTIGESKGYPYNEDELLLDKLSVIGDKPLIVGSGGVVVLSQDADKLNELHLDWGDTKVVTFNGRAFVYSNTQGNAYLLSRTGILAEFAEDSPIVTATVGTNGTVALSCSDDSTQSVVKVYTPRHKLDFEWQCSKEYVSSLALSDSGKKVLVSAVGVKNAEIYSRILMFRTNRTEADFDIKLEGTAILKVFCTSHNKITAVGDNRTVTLNRKGEIITEIKYADDALYNVDCDAKGNVLLCYKEFGGAKVNVTYIPSYGKAYKEFELDYMPASADIKGKKLAFSNGSTVDILSPAGSKRRSYECEHNVGTVHISNTGIYTLENGSIYSY